MLSIYHLPTLNAILNGMSFLFLLSGFFFIKRRMIAAHKTCMLSALIVSLLFLISYLIYHYHAGSVPFTGEGWIRPVYFIILTTHTILAVTIIPLAGITLFRALRGQFTKHLRIAHWALPIWLYVSITGVIIYGMLYIL